MSFNWQSILKGTCRVASSVMATRPRINGGSPRGDESWLPDCTWAASSPGLSESLGCQIADEQRAPLVYQCVWVARLQTSSSPGLSESGLPDCTEPLVLLVYQSVWVARLHTSSSLPWFSRPLQSGLLQLREPAACPARRLRSRADWLRREKQQRLAVCIAANTSEKGGSPSLQIGSVQRRFFWGDFFL